jgi:hypothetical protein
VVDDGLATTLHMIYMAITPKDRAHIRSLETVKDAWDLTDLFLRNKSIQNSKFSEVNTTADGLAINSSEIAEYMYRLILVHWNLLKYEYIYLEI